MLLKDPKFIQDRRLSVKKKMAYLKEHEDSLSNQLLKSYYQEKNRSRKLELDYKKFQRDHKGRTKTATYGSRTITICE